MLRISVFYFPWKNTTTTTRNFWFIFSLSCQAAILCAVAVCLAYTSLPTYRVYYLVPGRQLVVLKGWKIPRSRDGRTDVRGRVRRQREREKKVSDVIIKTDGCFPQRLDVAKM